MPSLFASQKAFGLLTVASSLMFTASTSAETLSAQLCAQFQAFANSDGQYIFNNNAWGEDSSGAECTNVFDDGASFETIWSWEDNGNDTHSFPNVQLNSAALLPLPLANLSEMNIQASWSMTPIDGATRANVVYDMFIDPDETTSGNTTTAKYEVMFWIGAFGDPFPLGASVNPFTGVVNTSLPSVELANTTFTLYSGENDGGQIVHSWLALTNQTDFTADASPLITYLTKNNLIESDTFMGIFQFGSETWHSTANVTFNVKSFDINITSTDSAVNAAASAALHPSSTSGSSTSSASTSTSTGSPSSPASSSSSSSSSTGTSSSSSSSSSSSGSSSSSSTVSLPFWFWEIAAAGCLFAML